MADSTLMKFALAFALLILLVPSIFIVKRFGASKPPKILINFSVQMILFIAVFFLLVELTLLLFSAMKGSQ
jgi:hypothetical protein